MKTLHKGAPEKTALAWWLRERPAVSLRWVTERVGRMKHKPELTLQPLEKRVILAEETKA